MSNKQRSHIVVIVPVFNEEDVIRELHSRLSAVLKYLPVSSEIMYVIDGSSDNTLKILDEIQTSAPGNVSLVVLSRNFGKEIAITAGLDRADADAVIIIDADLQDPPELIPDMLLKWRSGVDIVNMRRRNRHNEGFFKRSTAQLFYKLMEKLGSIDIPANVGDFRLLDHRVVMSLRQFPERGRMMKGLFSWVGYKTATIDYDRSTRVQGQSKFKIKHLTNLALDGITSFTTAPLRLASYIGMLVSVLAFILGVYVVIKSIVYGDPVAGFPTLMTTIAFIGGMQLLAIGVLGEYLGRVFIEAKQRPLYFIDNYKPAKSSPSLELHNSLPVNRFATERRQG